jgi:hypothetical protein
MGYRSEVAFCLRVKEPEQFVALTRVNAEDALKEMLDNMYYMEGADEVDYILFTHNYWKWYDDSNFDTKLKKLAREIAKTDHAIRTSH